MLTIEDPKMKGQATIAVESDAFGHGQPIPDPYSAYDASRSPELHWSGVPAQAKSLALLVEDPDAPRPTPFVHWVLYDVPPTRSTLPADLPADAELATVDRARQGRTSAGELGYFGPRPPRGDEPHHYHFELFALDTTLSLQPGARSDDVVRAMRGHVLASGDLVGLYRAPQR